MNCTFLIQTDFPAWIWREFCPFGIINLPTVLKLSYRSEVIFYIVCPDNDVDRATDEKRMAWTMGDIIENRPPLSRWHPDWGEASPVLAAVFARAGLRIGATLEGTKYTRIIP